MRDYGVVSPKFWIGGTGKALRGNQEAQIVALYLMTSPHANMIGVFYCPLDTIAKETGLTSEGARKGLRRLIEADFANFDEDTEEVFAVRMAAYQVGERLEAKDNRCKGVARELDKVMSGRLKAAFHAIYSVAFHLPPLAQNAPATASHSEAPSDPLRSQEQDQDQKQDQKLLAPIGACPPAANEAPAKGYKVPDCPHAQIVELYHANCPTLPACEVLNDSRRGMLRQRWREVCTAEKFDTAQGMDWWRDFFAFVSESNFLTGRAKPRPGGEPFLADFEWLIGPKNFAKVIERRYHRKAA